VTVETALSTTNMKVHEVGKTFNIHSNQKIIYTLILVNKFNMINFG